MVKFSLPGSLKYQGSRPFYHSSYGRSDAFSNKNYECIPLLFIRLNISNVYNVISITCNGYQLETDHTGYLFMIYHLRSKITKSVF